MGNIVSITVSATIDYFAGSITGMLWEWVFPMYNQSSGRVLNLITGLLQMGATVTTASYAASLLTPANFSKDNTIGMIGVVFFAFMFSPNMMAKLRSTHNQIKSLLIVPDGGFITMHQPSPSLLDESNKKKVAQASSASCMSEKKECQ